MLYVYKTTIDFLKNSLMSMHFILWFMSIIWWVHRKETWTITIIASTGIFQVILVHSYTYICVTLNYLIMDTTNGSGTDIQASHYVITGIPIFPVFWNVNKLLTFKWKLESEHQIGIGSWSNRIGRDTDPSNLQPVMNKNGKQVPYNFCKISVDVVRPVYAFNISCKWWTRSRFFLDWKRIEMLL